MRTTAARFIILFGLTNCGAAGRATGDHLVDGTFAGRAKVPSSRMCSQLAVAQLTYPAQELVDTRVLSPSR